MVSLIVPVIQNPYPFTGISAGRSIQRIVDLKIGKRLHIIGRHRRLCRNNTVITRKQSLRKMYHLHSRHPGIDRNHIRPGYIRQLRTTDLRHRLRFGKRKRNIRFVSRLGDLNLRLFDPETACNLSKRTIANTKQYARQ